MCFGTPAATAPTCSKPGYFQYVVTATPLTMGFTGNRSFCSDQPGIIHFDTSALPLLRRRPANFFLRCSSAHGPSRYRFDPRIERSVNIRLPGRYGAVWAVLIHCKCESRCHLHLGDQLAFSSPPQNAQEIVRAVEARYAHARTLEAKFYERYRASGQPGQSESGTVYFSKPGRMRWEYESPHTKLFLVDGTNVWLYVPADRTASRAKLKESDDWRTPLALLTGKVHLERLCGKIALGGASQGSGSSGEALLDPRNRVLICSPRSSGAAGGELILPANPV